MIHKYHKADMPNIYSAIKQQPRLLQTFCKDEKGHAMELFQYSTFIKLKLKSCFTDIQGVALFENVTK